MKTSSLRARRPGAREMPGRCGLRLAAEPHRPFSCRRAKRDLRLATAPRAAISPVSALQQFPNPQDVGAPPVLPDGGHADPVNSASDDLAGYSRMEVAGITALV